MSICKRMVRSILEYTHVVPWELLQAYVARHCVQNRVLSNPSPNSWHYNLLFVSLHYLACMSCAYSGWWENGWINSCMLTPVLVWNINDYAIYVVKVANSMHTWLKQLSFMVKMGNSVKASKLRVLIQHTYNHMLRQRAWIVQDCNQSYFVHPSCSSCSYINSHATSHPTSLYVRSYSTDLAFFTECILTENVFVSSSNLVSKGTMKSVFRDLI